MNLFISYARVDKPYCIQIVNRLTVHDVWFDDRLYGGDNWWDEILRRLEWCEGFVYLVSEDSVKSTYCLRELRIALNAQREIIPVLIQKGVALPDEIKHQHYVDLTDGLTVDSIGQLLDSIVMAARRHENKEHIEIDPDVFLIESGSLLDPPTTTHVDSAYQMSIQAWKEGDFDRCIMLFKQLKLNGFDSEVIDLDLLIRKAEQEVKRRELEKRAVIEYQRVKVIVLPEETREVGCEIFAKFQKRFPNYDPDNLASLCEGFKADNWAVGNTWTGNQGSGPRPITIPKIKYVPIPMGTTRVEMHNENVTGQIKHIRVKPFRISQYPITNLQFQAFLDAPDGYSNEKWWSSRHAKHWWQQHPHHPRPHTMSKTTPRETVSWYSALAFCKWLAHHTGRRLRLPHLAHWQRAVQGQDDRMFPWGNDFDPTRCNTRETGQKVPTPVDCYPQGRSPYDVYDLAGNVWEWCMDYQEEDDVLTGGDRIRKRAVVGGSAVSPLERAQVGEHFYLHPNTVFGSIGFRIVDLSE